MSEKKPVFTTRSLALTAVLLALCILFQCLKSFSVYITGSAVNAILVLATLYCGLPGGLAIAVLSPVVAAILGATPIINMIPLMMAVIMVGNIILVLFTWTMRKKLIAGLVCGSVCKAAFLWLTVWYVMLPVFGANVPAPAQAAMRVTFSVTQLVAALIGSAIAWVVYSRLKTVKK